MNDSCWCLLQLLCFCIIHMAEITSCFFPHLNKHLREKRFESLWSGYVHSFFLLSFKKMFLYKSLTIFLPPSFTGFHQPYFCIWLAPFHHYGFLKCTMGPRYILLESRKVKNSAINYFHIIIQFLPEMYFSKEPELSRTK